MKEAIELIQSEIPPKVLRNILSKLPASELGSELSVENFSFGRLQDLENFKTILERRLDSNEIKANGTLRKWYNEELAFVRESFAASTERQVWHGYCIKEANRFSVLKRRKRVWFLVDVGRKTFLRWIDPRPVAFDH